jgi:hypothetical protein
MEYKVVSRDFIVGDFERDVNILIKQGWKPLGGISVVILSSGNIRYIQAMVK